MFREEKKIGLLMGIFAGVAVFLLTGVIVAGIWLGNIWSTLESASKADVFVSGIAATGTIVLALATFSTVYQNQRNLVEQKRDREKPIAVDVINKTIQPILPRLESDLKMLRENDELDMDWYYPDGPSTSIGDHPSSVFLPRFTQNEDLTAKRRLQRDYPEIWSNMEERENLVKEMCEIADEIAEAAVPKFEGYVEEQDLINDNGEQPSMDVLLSASMKRLKRYGESHEDFQIWEKHGQRFIEILYDTSEAQMKELDQKEKQLLEMTENLERDLVNVKLHLREKYGISSEEIIQDADIPEVV